MGISHKPKIPRIGEISLWYDASNPQGSALGALNKRFSTHEPTLRGFSAQQDYNTGYDASTVATGAVSGVPTYSDEDSNSSLHDHGIAGITGDLREALLFYKNEVAILIDEDEFHHSGGNVDDFGWQYVSTKVQCPKGLKDLSGNNYDCALVAGDKGIKNSTSFGNAANYYQPDRGIQLYPVKGKWYFSLNGAGRIDGNVQSYNGGNDAFRGVVDWRRRGDPSWATGDNGGNYPSILYHNYDDDSKNATIKSGADNDGGFDALTMWIKQQDPHINLNEQSFAPYSQNNSGNGDINDTSFDDEFRTRSRPDNIWCREGFSDSLHLGIYCEKDNNVATASRSSNDRIPARAARGFLGGRPVRSMYVAMNHWSPCDKDGPGMRDKSWRMVINNETVALSDGYPEDRKLKIGDVIHTETHGEFEVGPIVHYTSAGTRNWDNHDGTYETVGALNYNRPAGTSGGGLSVRYSNYKNAVGTTFHAIRPAKSNVLFPQPKYSHDNFRKAVMPLRPTNDDYLVLHNVHLSMGKFSGDSGSIQRNQGIEVNTMSFWPFGGFSGLDQDETFNGSGLHPSLGFRKLFDTRYDMYIYDSKGSLVSWLELVNSDPSTSASNLQTTINNRPIGSFYAKPIWSYSMGDYNHNGTSAEKMLWLQNSFDSFSDSSYDTNSSYTKQYHLRGWSLEEQRRLEGTYGTSLTVADFQNQYYTELAETNNFSVVIAPGGTSQTISSAIPLHVPTFPAVEYETHETTPGYIQLAGFRHSGAATSTEKEYERRKHLSWGAIDSRFSFSASDQSGEFTFSMWCRGDGSIPYKAQDSKACKGFLFDIGHAYAYITSSGTIKFGTRSIANETNYTYLETLTSGANPGGSAERLYNEWMMLSFTYSVSDGLIKIYVNGSLVSTSAYNASLLSLGQGTNTDRIFGYLGRQVSRASWEAFENGSRENSGKSRFCGVDDVNYEGLGPAPLQISCVHSWKYNKLSDTEIKSLYDNTKSAFEPVEKSKVDVDSNIILDTPYYKRNSYVQKEIDEALKDFTAESDIRTVTYALENASWCPTICHSVLDETHMAQDLEAFNITNYNIDGGNYSTKPRTLCRDFGGTRYDRTPDKVGHFPSRMVYKMFNPRCWDDPMLDDNYVYSSSLDNIDANGNYRHHRLRQTYNCLGMAAFEKDKYLGTTYWFIVESVSGTTNTGPSRFVADDIEQARDVWRELGASNRSMGSTGTHREEESCYLIHGYTHDVSGYYQVNGKPSSVDNPYILKTTAFPHPDANVSNTNTVQGWNYSTNQIPSGAPQTNTYSTASGASRNKMSADGGLWGWKPGEFLHGNMNETGPGGKQDGIWGIANWNGEDNDAKAWWGPNKEFDIGATGSDELKFYCFYFYSPFEEINS